MFTLKLWCNSIKKGVPFMAHPFLFCNILFLLLYSCTNQIDPIPDTCYISEDSGVYVLCEGLYGYNNSSLWYQSDLSSPPINVFPCKNNGYALGDTANDIIKINDSLMALIISTSNEIHIMNSKTAKVIRSIVIQGNGHFLKKGVIFQDSLLLVTDLYADIVYQVNINSSEYLPFINLQLCAPEGIAVFGNTVAVCNSGYGIFRYKEPFAGTVLFYEIKTNTYTSVKTGINPQSIYYSLPSNSWFVLYSHITSMKDSIGGITEIEANSLHPIRDHKETFTGRGFYDTSLHILYAISKKGIHHIQSQNTILKDSLILPAITGNQMYGIARNHSNLYILNARNFMVSGQILIYDLLTNRYTYSHEIGINPSKLLFK
jgi:hypothetical protein